MLSDGDSRALIPKYSELPVIAELGLPHAWDVFGSSDEIGSLNRLTPSRVLDGIRTVQHGEVISLDVPLGMIDPPLFGREAMRHTVFAASRNEYEDRLDSYFLQSSTQWDGLAHIRCREFGFWGGRTSDLVPGRELGINRWAEHGVVGRAVLLDVARARATAGRPLDPWSNDAITAVDLLQTAEAQAVDIREGDILCIRTGWLSWYRGLTSDQRGAISETPRFPGLDGSVAVAETIWDWGVSALLADNPAVERAPGDPEVGSLHRRLIPLLGIACGELFDFDSLASSSLADGRFDFLFMAAPMNLPGGISSPGNAVAIR